MYGGFFVFCLVVNDTLEEIRDFSLGEYYFPNQKGLNQRLMDNWRNSKSKYKSVDEFVSTYREYCKDKMVIEFTDRESENIMFSPFGLIQVAEIQKKFEEIKKIVKITGFVINSLQHYVDIALRRIVVQNYYKTNIAPKISQHALELNDRNPTGFHIKSSGWGYIASFKHKVVMEFAERPCYWIKLLFSNESLELVEQNLTKNKDNRIFIGKPDDSIRYIDIFTSDEGSAHLFGVIADDNIKVLNVNLTPLTELLKKHDLYYAIKEWGTKDLVDWVEIKHD